MTFLSLSPVLDPNDPAHSLLALQEEEALQAAIGALEPEAAARAIGQAPTVEAKSRLVWALAPERRAEVLDQFHPGFVGALIQNREAENKALLGDLSREQFTRLLRYCNPERAYYWLTLATSFEHPRANMLPLLVPVEELAAALLTMPEFVRHCQEVGEYNVGEFSLEQDDFLDIASATVTVFGPEGVVEEFPILEEFPIRDHRLRGLLHTLEHHPEQYNATVTIISTDGAMEELPIRDPRLRRLLHRLLDFDLEQYHAVLNLFGAEGVLREFPIRDRRLRRLLQTVLDHDPEHYVALIQAALQLTDYAGSHPEEQESLCDSPLILKELLTLDEERSRVGLRSGQGETATPASRSASGPAEGESHESGPRVPNPRPPTRGGYPPAKRVTVSSGTDRGPRRVLAEPGELRPATGGFNPGAGEPERGDEMTFLSRSPSLDPNDPVNALLSLQEEEALQAAMNALEPEDAAAAIGRASSLEDRSRLIWALLPDRRAEVLDRLHPGFVGALIQNQEIENKALLGDLSREQFTRLLRYCSPERAYYWLTLAASFEDARANLLPLLVPIRELASAMLTQPEFESHCQRIGDYSVEDLRLDLGDFRDLAFAIVTVFGADGMLREFPIKDPRLRQLCQTILDHEPEHYGELIHTALQLSDYESGHPEEQEVLRDEPVLLTDLLTVDEERARAGVARPEAPSGRASAAEIRNVPSLPARRSAELMRAAAAELPAQRQNELSQEMQLLFLQEAAYAGGSFLQADLEHAAGRVQSYIQLGLAGLSEGDTGQAAQLLSEQRLRTLMESGARQVERLRQVALRLQPWRELLDKEQIRLLTSLEHPDMGIEGENDRPVLRLRRAARGPAAGSLDLETARTQLEAIDAWIALVRAVGKARIARRKADTDTATLTRDLIVAAVLYRLWDPALVEPADRERFRSTYQDPTTGRWSPTAYRALAEAIRTLAAERSLQPAAVEKIALLLSRVMDAMAGGDSA